MYAQILGRNAPYLPHFYGAYRKFSGALRGLQLHVRGGVETQQIYEHSLLYVFHAFSRK